MQETLREFGIVFWCNHEMRFNSSNIASLRGRAEAVGLVTWPSLPHPTSTYTHDGMFRHLGTDRQFFHFQRMAEPDSALYANTYRLHSRLLRPWVECALDLDCLSPPGSQVGVNYWCQCTKVQISLDIVTKALSGDDCQCCCHRTVRALLYCGTNHCI